MRGVGQLATTGEVSSQQPNTELNKTSNWSPPASHISTPPSYSSLHSPGAEQIREECTEDGCPLYMHAHYTPFWSTVIILCSSNPPNNAYSSCADSCIRGVAGILCSLKIGLISRAHAIGYGAHQPLMEAQFHHIPALTWPMSWLGKNKHKSTQPTG